MNKLTIMKYTFLPYFSGYFQEGRWYSDENKEIKEKYYNGRICLDFKGKRYGINKLKTFAIRNEVEVEELPF